MNNLLFLEILHNYPYQQFVKDKEKKIEEIYLPLGFNSLNDLYINLKNNLHGYGELKKKLFYKGYVCQEEYTVAPITTPKDIRYARALHALLGIISEIEEIMNEEPMEEETGDILFYVTMLANIQELTLDEIALCNFNKLSLRYKEGFTDKEALERKDKNG